ncbi:hypothetical protein PI125_g6894 [Phytophthora idaei]|nr:hypothetical protein PI125_g6894 [Phytophthora idaei]
MTNIYTLMITNLRLDCKLGIVDPVAELQRLQPDSQRPATPELAAAQLYSQLLQERTRPVDSRVPSTHWASPHMLRACAQYLRQPLAVTRAETSHAAI